MQSPEKVDPDVLLRDEIIGLAPERCQNCPTLRDEALEMAEKIRLGIIPYVPDVENYIDDEIKARCRVGVTAVLNSTVMRIYCNRSPRKPSTS